MFKIPQISPEEILANKTYKCHDRSLNLEWSFVIGLVSQFLLLGSTRAMRCSRYGCGSVYEHFAALKHTMCCGLVRKMLIHPA